MNLYKIVRYDNSDGNYTGNPRVLGYGPRKEVLVALKLLRDGGLPGYRYVMERDSEAKNMTSK